MIQRHVSSNWKHPQTSEPLSFLLLPLYVQYVPGLRTVLDLFYCGQRNMQQNQIFGAKDAVMTHWTQPPSNLTSHSEAIVVHCDKKAEEESRTKRPYCTVSYSNVDRRRRKQGDESKSKIPPKRRDFPHIFSRISARISRFIALCHMPKSWKTRNEQNWHLSHQYDFYVTNSAEKLLKFFFETSGKEIPRFWITMHADKTLLRETNYSRSLLSVAKRISYTTISV